MRAFSAIAGFLAALALFSGYSVPAFAGGDGEAAMTQTVAVGESLLMPLDGERAGLLKEGQCRFDRDTGPRLIIDVQQPVAPVDSRLQAAVFIVPVAHGVGQASDARHLIGSFTFFGSGPQSLSYTLDDADLPDGVRQALCDGTAQVEIALQPLDVNTDPATMEAYLPVDRAFLTHP
jgi:hypothetical protein